MGFRNYSFDTVLPAGTVCDYDVTNGKDISGTIVSEEEAHTFSNSLSVVSFVYQQDAEFTINLAHGKKSFLFTGDAELKSETDMINSKQNLQANVLKVGHHGAKTSSSSAFLKKVKPQYAVISVGKNAYGHPTKEVLNRLKPAKVLRTDQKGSIVFTTNGSTLSVRTEKK